MVLGYFDIVKQRSRQYRTRPRIQVRLREMSLPSIIGKLEISELESGSAVFYIGRERTALDRFFRCESCVLLFSFHFAAKRRMRKIPHLEKGEYRINSNVQLHLEDFPVCLSLKSIPCSAGLTENLYVIGSNLNYWSLLRQRVRCRCFY